MPTTVYLLQSTAVLGGGSLLQSITTSTSQLVNQLISGIPSMQFIPTRNVRSVSDSIQPSTWLELVYHVLLMFGWVYIIHFGLVGVYAIMASDWRGVATGCSLSWGCRQRHAILDQVYIEVVRPGSVSVCYVHATTAEACFAASMIRLTMHTS